MGSDMVVALARATADGHTLFGHNNRRPQGEAQTVLLEPGRAFAPGETVPHQEGVPQVRHTWTVLGCRADGQWGYQHGVNERGVAAGVTTIYTRPEREKSSLTGPDLVRLVLERASNALQGVDVLTDLIGRHGQGTATEDSAFVVVDGREAHVLEACGNHWALQAVGGVRAVSSACHLRRDWDRISRGLADLAIARGWWPEDGSKLDFAGAVGRDGPDHAAALRRWGQATLALEQQNGQITDGFLRRVLAGEGLAGHPSAHLEEAASSLIVQLTEGAPLVWYSLGGGLYFPLSLAGPLPPAFGAEDGAGSRVWQQWASWRADARHDARLRWALRAGVMRLQERFDQNARELPDEMIVLKQRGAEDELRALAGSFMQHNLERFEELAAELHGGGARAEGEAVARPESAEELAGANF